MFYIGSYYCELCSLSFMQKNGLGRHHKSKRHIYRKMIKDGNYNRNIYNNL